MSSSATAIIQPPSRDRTPRSSVSDLNKTPGSNELSGNTFLIRYPLMIDGKHSPQNVCLISFILGLVGAFGMICPHPLATYSSAIVISLEAVYLGRAILNQSNQLSSFIWDKRDLLLLFLSLGVLEFTLRSLIFSKLHWGIFLWISNVGYVVSLLSSSVLFISHVSPIINRRELNSYLTQVDQLFPYWKNPENVASFYLLLSSQLILLNPLTIGAVIHYRHLLTDKETFEHIRSETESRKLRYNRGILGLPLFDNEHTEQNVSLYAFLLGLLGGLGLAIGRSHDSSFKGFGLFALYIAIFHTFEYITTAMYKKNVSLTSFLLNHSREYHLAMIAGVVEYWIEYFFFPSMKSLSFLNWVGVIIAGLSQLLRTVAMITAGASFSHIIMEHKEEDHTLVTHGVYSIFRHPSYTGFFYWSLGLQLLLGNPLCFFAYIKALYTFFSDRIAYEEETLIDFFGDAYREHRKRTYIFIPGIN